MRRGISSVTQSALSGMKTRLAHFWTKQENPQTFPRKEKERKKMCVWRRRRSLRGIAQHNMPPNSQANPAIQNSGLRSYGNSMARSDVAWPSLHQGHVPARAAHATRSTQPHSDSCHCIGMMITLAFPSIFNCLCCLPSPIMQLSCACVKDTDMNLYTHRHGVPLP